MYTYSGTHLIADTAGYIASVPPRITTRHGLVAVAPLAHAIHAAWRSRKA